MGRPDISTGAHTGHQNSVPEQVNIGVLYLACGLTSSGQHDVEASIGCKGILESAMFLV